MKTVVCSQRTRELISTQNTSHKYSNKDLLCVFWCFLSTNRAVFSRAVSLLLLLLLLNKVGPLVGCTVMMFEDVGCIMCFVFCRAVAPITPLRPDPLFTERCG